MLKSSKSSLRKEMNGKEDGSFREERVAEMGRSL